MPVVEMENINEVVTEATVSDVIWDMVEDILTENDLFSEKCSTELDSGNWRDAGGSKVNEAFELDGRFSVTKDGEFVSDGTCRADLSCPRDDPDRCNLEKIRLKIDADDSYDIIMKCR